MAGMLAAAALAAQQSGSADRSVSQPGDSIAWFAGDIDHAFEAARAAGKPLFLYWGASWCPPCNRIKATVFKRRDFVERSHQFVAYYLDGDSASAQKLAARFKVTGYPTMILFGRDGAEVTRLPGELDHEQYLQALSLAINAARPARAALAAALGTDTDGAAATAQDCRLLAYYSWGTDDGQVVARDRLVDALKRLAVACRSEPAAISARFKMRALIQSASRNLPATATDKAAMLGSVHEVLSDPALARDVFDLLTANPAAVTRYLTAAGSPTRQTLLEEWDRALRRLDTDASLSNSDRLNALEGRVALARLSNPGSAIAAALLDDVRTRVVSAEREAVDPYERQSVISQAAELLAMAGLTDESDALLRAELARSPAPYYLMQELAVLAKKRGDIAATLDWHQQAYDAARGPATRLQWGANYVRALVELMPDDSERIERVLCSVIDGLDPMPDTFYKRNRTNLELIGTTLATWNQRHEHDALMTRVRARMDTVCDKLPAGAPERAACTGALGRGSPVQQS
jgi:thioredoxin-related protein